MTSKERVMRAVNHEAVDKIPVDLGGSVQSTIHVYAYAALKKALGIEPGDVEVSDSYILSAMVEDSVVDALQIDAVPILCPLDCLGVRNDLPKKDWTMPSGLEVKISEDFNAVQQENGAWILDKGGFRFKLPGGGYYFDAVQYALQDAETKKDVDEKFDFSGYTDEQVEFLRRQAGQLKGTDKAVIGDVFASFSAEDHFGYEKALMNLIVKKDLTVYFIERVTDMFIRNFDLFYDAVGDVCDIMMMHKDMGNQLGPMISPEVAREVFVPSFRKFVAHVKEKSKYKVMMHNCGSIYAFIPDLIDCGIDILNPVQFTAKDMELEKLKREFGKDLCFWGGGVDTQHTLPFGSEQEVRRHVRENAEILSEGSGYVFGPVHCVQAQVPVENIIAAFDEINRFKPAA
jgi:uroporphyrinogen decarboxylase